jgi:hypothetical protein
VYFVDLLLVIVGEKKGVLKTKKKGINRKL